MSVIIRLQNLPWSANSLDIRQYFRGLSIPEGGVHIVGGEQGDAFIAFSTDEDARQAMMKDCGPIKESKIKLLLSSRTEMQKVIEQARQQTLALQGLLPITSPFGTNNAVPNSTPISNQTNTPLPLGNSVMGPANGVDLKDADKVRDADKDKDRKDRRERSHSRERRKERDRRKRDRSRSRSKSRDRSRRRSRSRERRDKDRDRRRRDRDRDRDRKREDDVIIDLEVKNSVSNGSLPQFNDVNNQNNWKPAFSSLPTQLPFGAPGLLSCPEQNKTFDVVKRDEVPNQPERRFRPSRFGPDLATEASFNNRPFGVGRGNAHEFRPQRNERGPDVQRFPVRPGMFPGEIINPMEDRPVIVPPMNNVMNGMPFEGNKPSRFSNDGISDMEVGRFDRGRERFGNNRSYDLGLRGRDRHSDTLDKEKDRKSDKGRDKIQTKGVYVELRNLPLKTSYKDIREFFKGISIASGGIKIINDNHGNRTGIAYVQFLKTDDKEAALKKNGNLFNNEPIDVLPLADSIFERAIDSYSPDSKRVSANDHRSSRGDKDIKDKLHDRERDRDRDRDRGDRDRDRDRYNTNEFTVIALRGLPAHCSEDDLVKFFKDFRVVNSIVVVDQDRRCTGVGYVHLADASEAKEAMHRLSNQTLNHCYVRLSPSSPEVIARCREELQRDVPQFDMLDTDCVVMQGLPTTTTDREVVDFYSDVGLCPIRIHVMLDRFGGPSGDVFCEFGSREDVSRAITKSGSFLGNHKVSVSPVLRGEMEGALRPFPQPVDGFNPDISVRPRFPNRPIPGQGILGHSPQSPNMMSRKRSVNSLIPNALGNSKSVPALGPQTIDPPNQTSVDMFGNVGSVVALENVPYKASIEEILEFFQGFGVTKDQVIRRYNEKGFPTGDARVAFASPSVAQAAVLELNQRCIRNRPVYMSVA